MVVYGRPNVSVAVTEHDDAALAIRTQLLF
jgi:hypothetical protein